MVRKKGQIKIQQMAFMIVAVLLFFVLVGLFFLSWQSKSLKGSYEQLQKEQAISGLSVIADMAELNCDSRESLCLDEDKLQVMASSTIHDEIWPVASVKIYKVYPAFDSAVKCPALGCNYYEVYNSRQANLKEYSTYVSLCKKVKEFDYVYDKCEIGKLVVGAEDET